MDDLYICNVDKDQLLRNNEGRYFEDVISQAFDISSFDTRGGRSTTASWGDVNRDGYLDLYVTHHQIVREENREIEDLQDYFF